MSSKLHVDRTAARDSTEARPTMFERHFRPLCNLPCWGVQWEPQVNLSMHFGQPHLEIREPRRSSAASEAVRLSFAHRGVSVRGKWWLWLHCSRWTLQVRGLEPVRSSGASTRIRRALRLLNGQSLTRTTVDSTNGRTTFEFDLGATLKARALDDSVAADIWSLYKPDGRVLSVRGDGTFSLDRGDATATYRPIPPPRR